MTAGKQRRNWVLHPFLFVLYLVCGVLAENPGEAQPADALRAGATLLTATGLSFAIVAMRRGAYAAGLLCSFTLVLLFSHAGLYGGWLGESAGGVGGAGLYIALGLSLSLLVSFGVLLAKTRLSHAGAWRVLSRGLDVVVGGLCVLVLAEVTLYQLSEDDGTAHLEASRAVDPIPLPAAAAQGPKPDIYYIVLDAYTRSDTLQAFYNGDNTGLLDFLGARGFEIADRSHSNYLSTKLVLPAVFNLDYLDALAARVGPASQDVRPLRAATEHNRIVETLRGIGYRIVNINSGPDYVTIADPDAAYELAAGFLGFTEFEAALADMTPLPALFDRLDAGAAASPAGVHRRRVEYAIETLAKQADEPGPKFVIAHVFAPHDPIVFGRQGEMRSVSIRLFHDYTAAQQQYLMSAYRDEVHYLDGLLTDALERLLDGSENPPIVVLQGDHGLRLFLARSVEQTCLRESFSILNAVLLPGVDPGSVPATLSPVNTFRLILDTYFGTELGLLEDRAYFSHRFGLYDFVDVTAEVESCATQASLPRPF
jgi:hypothetical protein